MAEHPTRTKAAAAKGTYPRNARATLRLENGAIVVENPDGGGDVIRVGNGGVIHWSCEDPIRWWAIVMTSETPFDGDDGWAGCNRGKQGVTRIRQDAHGGGTRSYEYAIIASDGKQVFFRDPEVVVGPRDDDDDGG